MKILIVANHNTGKFAPYIVEQVDTLNRLGVEMDYFGVHGKGIRGYLSNLNALKAKINQFKPDLVHAHYGLSGLLANLQRKVPVITTYHGSDIHSKGLILFFSRLSIMLSNYNIFVSAGLLKQSGYRGYKKCLLPCGVDCTTFKPMERKSARELLSWDSDKKYVLFAGAFDNYIKNSPLAKAAIAKIQEAQLIEMRGFSREQVNLVMNAADCLLLTSYREGSPQVIKEALTCGTPIVSVNAGDAKDMLTGIDGCYVSSYDIDDIVSCLRKALSFQGKTNGWERISQRQLDNEQIVKKLYSIYQQVINE